MYWKHRPQVTESTPPSRSSSPTSSVDENNDSIIADFDQHRQLLLNGTSSETWAAEVRRYLRTVEVDVKRDTDILKWWQVCYFHFLCPSDD
jgi:hypothetical protein